MTLSSTLPILFLPGTLSDHPDGRISLPPHPKKWNNSTRPDKNSACRFKRNTLDETTPKTPKTILHRLHRGAKPSRLASAQAARRNGSGGRGGETAQIPMVLIDSNRPFLPRCCSPAAHTPSTQHPRSCSTRQQQRSAARTRDIQPQPLHTCAAHNALTPPNHALPACPDHLHGVSVALGPCCGFRFLGFFGSFCCPSFIHRFSFIHFHSFIHSFLQDSVPKISGRARRRPAPFATTSPRFIG